MVETAMPRRGRNSRRNRGVHLLEGPTISYSDKPLDADDWLGVIETKLDPTVYTGEECVANTAHQLNGSAKSWWDNYVASHPNPVFITWLEFRMAICK
jgi:hypothetical protein